MSLSERTVALAGLFQAVGLVDSLAVEGAAEAEAFETSVDSIHTLDADSVAGCYGGHLERLARGRDTLRAALAQDPGARRPTHYAFALMSLERGVHRRPALREEIAEGIRATTPQVQHFGSTHDQVLARLADLYAGTVSRLRPRVMVHGSPLHLQQERTVTRIRALLLAGLRSAVLWRQLGGARWQFLFRRAAIARDLETWARTTR